jgi:hypothetical protein
VYLEAYVEQNGIIVDVIYGEYPSLEGLDVGARIPHSRLTSSSSSVIGEYEILESEIIKNRETTQFDPKKINPMIKLKLKKLH